MAETGCSSSAIPERESVDAVSAGNAADNNEPKAKRRNRMRMLAEKKRRIQVMNYLGELKALMPHVTEKKMSNKKAIVGQTIKYIQSLEKTKAMLEKRKQEMALARQVAADAAASSSSAPPQTAQGTMAAAMFSDVRDGCHDVPAPPPPLQPLAADVPMSVDVPQPLQPLADEDVPMSVDVPQPLLLQQPLAAAVPAPPQFPTEAAGLAGFQTWSWPNLVLNVSNGNAHINVCSPRHLGMQNMVMVLSVLNNHGIDVVTAQVDSDAVRSVFNIYARVTRMGGEEVYKLAMSEILLSLNTN